MKHRLVSLVLVICLLVGLVPQVAVSNRAEAATTDATLRTFAVSYTDADGKTVTHSLLGEGQEFSLPDGAAYVFSVSFSDNSRIGTVYVTSTTAEGTASLQATFDEGADCFVTSGYFNGNSVYLPGKLSVEYYEKAESVLVSEEFPLTDYELPELSVSDALVSNGDEGMEASVAIAKVLKSQEEVVVNAFIDSYAPAVGEAADAFDKWKGAIKDLDELVCYTVPGKDDEKYLLYLTTPIPIPMP